MNTLVWHVTLATFFAVTAAQTCPRDWVTTQFVIASVGDQEVDAVTAAGLGFDPSNSYMRDIVRFSDEEIERFGQNAITFYRERYGLNFSSPPDPETGGRSFFQNATLFPYRVFTNFTVTSNSYIVNGRTNSKCYLAREGGLTVVFSGVQMLHGTYGGEEGLPVFPGDFIDYAVFAFFFCPVGPTRIQVECITPNRAPPVDGFATINYRLFNRDMGSGVGQGTFRFIESIPGVSFRLISRFVYQFPDLSV